MKDNQLRALANSLWDMNHEMYDIAMKIDPKYCGRMTDAVEIGDELKPQSRKMLDLIRRLECWIDF